MNHGDPHRQSFGESHCGHMIMCAGGFDNKHGVGILLNRGWKRKIIKSEHVSERMITAVLRPTKQKIVLAGVNIPHTGHTHIHIDKMYKFIEHPCKERHTAIIAGATSSAQLGAGEESGCVHVWKTRTRLVRPTNVELG